LLKRKHTRFGILSPVHECQKQRGLCQIILRILVKLFDPDLYPLDKKQGLPVEAAVNTVIDKLVAEGIIG